jgi:hypothetical protein
MKIPTFSAFAGFILACSVSGLAAESLRPKGVIGVPWGASRIETLKVLNERGMKLPEGTESLDKIQIAGGTFAGQDVASWTFEFTNGKFFTAAILLKPSDNPPVLFRDFKQQFLTKYGPAQSEKKIAGTDRRYSKGNSIAWRFSPTVSDKDQLSISLETGDPTGHDLVDENRFQMTIRYTNETLRALAEKTPKTEAHPTSTVKSEEL